MTIEAETLATANYSGAYLTNAKFDGARIDFCSHDVASEIFRQAAGNDPGKLEVARSGGSRHPLCHAPSVLAFAKKEWVS